MKDEVAPRRPQLPPTNHPSETKCLPCTPTHDDKSTERGCFSILPKSQSRPVRPDLVPKTQHGPTSKVPKPTPKASAPQWAQLAAPHVAYPHHHYLDPHVYCRNVAGLSHQVDWGRKGPASSFLPEPQHPYGATALRRLSMALPEQDTKAESSQRRAAEEPHLQRKERNGPRMPVEKRDKVRATRSSKDLGRYRIEQDHVPKRRQSVPEHRGFHGPHDIDICEKPLPDVPPASDNEMDMSPDAEWVDELPYEVPIKRENPEKAKSPQQDKAPRPRTRQRVPVRARQYSNKGQARPNIPQRISSMQTRVPSSNWDDSEAEIMDRDVLRGLHIAAAAACNEQVDAFIREQTGLHIRWFLANLMPLEHLGDELLRDARVQRARRSAEMRRVRQRMRRSRQMKTPDQARS